MPICNSWPRLRQRILNAGLSGSEEVTLARRIHLVNFGALLPPVSFFTLSIYLALHHIWPASLICFFGSIGNIMAYFLTTRRKHVASYVIMCLTNLLVYDSLAYFYGKVTGTDILMLLWLLAISILSAKQLLSHVMFVLGTISLFGMEVYFLNYDPVFQLPRALHSIFYVVLGLGVFYLYTVMAYFKRLNANYVAELSKKNGQLLKYFTAMEQTYATIVITDNKGNIEYVNPQFEATTGYRINEVIGLNPKILKSGKTPPERYIELWDTLNSGLVWKGEFINTRKNSQEYTERAIISPIKNQKGEITHFVAVKDDITLLKDAEGALFESQQKYRIIAENSIDVIWTLNFQTLAYSYISPSIYNLRGLNVEEALQEPLEKSLTPESYEKVMEMLSDLPRKLEQRVDLTNKGLEVRQPCKDGSIIHVEVNTNVICDELGRPREVLGISRDITKRKQIERVLEENELQLTKLLDFQTENSIRLSHQLNYIFNNASVSIAFFYLENSKIICSSCNRLWAGSLGFKPEDIIGVDIKSYCDTETLALHREFLDRCLLTGKAVQEYRQWRNMQLYINIFPVTDLPDAHGVSFAGFIYNVTDKLQAEFKMLESQEKFYNIFNKSSEILIVISADLEIIEANERLSSLLGYPIPNTSVAIDPGRLDKYIPAQYLSSINQMLDLFRKGQNTPLFECEVLHKNGYAIPVDISGSVFKLNDKPMILCSIRDNTDRKNYERKLAQVGVQIENRERRNLAADLHDNVGPLLSSMNMCLSALSRKTDIQNHLAAISDVQGILKEAIASVREISNNISPQVLKKYGLAAAIEFFFETKKVLVPVIINNEIGEFRFDETKESMIYNIIKEAFNNTIKYSGASAVTLNLKRNQKLIIVSYMENGCGFVLEDKLQASGDHLGLFSILNRIKLLEGGYRMETAPGKGFFLEVLFSL